MLAGNWKMNQSIEELPGFFEGFFAGLDGKNTEVVEMVVAPPFPMIPKCLELTKGSSVEVAVQNVHFEAKGAYTGEVSIPMIQEMGVEMAIVGHSERRQYFGETNDVVGKKVAACVQSNIRVIACVGETKEQRESGEMESVLKEQVEAILSASGDYGKLVIAYEPVWAIGTGLTATDEQAQAAHKYIRSLVQARFPGLASQLQILYGGSVKPGNVAGLVSQDDIDGALVGGASLKPQDFSEIVSQSI